MEVNLGENGGFPDRYWSTSQGKDAQLKWEKEPHGTGKAKSCTTGRRIGRGKTTNNSTSSNLER
jgi:hypothetical protein